ncbi:MAG: hypothetical protein HUK08_07050 [Bacteroidaceae bacterium]|nr:hypothetical protein [Bacteroidaceae bacterium]
MKRHDTLILFFIFAISLVTFCHIGFADGSKKYNNRYNIHPELYEMWERGSKHANKHWTLALSDSMARRADELGDKKAHCIALLLPINYYEKYIPKQYADSLRMACDKCFDYSIKTDFKQYAFYARHKLIVYLSNNNFREETTREIERLHDEAFKYNHPYGIRMYYGLMVQYYQEYKLYDKSIETAKEAIEYTNKNNYGKENFSFYRDIASAYLAKKNIDSAEYYIKKFKSMPGAAGDEIGQQHYLIMLSDLYLLKKDTAAVEKIIQELQERKDRGGLTSSTGARMKQILVEIAANRGNYAVADSVARTIKPSERDEHLAMTAARKGDYKTAYERLRAHYEAKEQDAVNSFASSVLSSEKRLKNSLSEQQRMRLAKEIKEEEAKREQAQRIAAEQKLKAEQAELARQIAVNEQTKANADKQSAIAEKAKTEKDHMTAEMEKAQSDAKLAKALAKNAEQEIQLEQAQVHKLTSERYRMMTVAGLLLVLFIAIVAFSTYKNHTNAKFMKEMEAAMHAIEEEKKKVEAAMHAIEEEKKKVEAAMHAIEEEKKKVEASNEVKEILIQNMRHEIRTPLNAIVGFSHLIANAQEYGFTKEEVNEYLTSIEAGTKNLTDIVNELIDSSLFATGSYTISLTETDVLASAREAVYTNEQRKTEEQTLVSDIPGDDIWFTQADPTKLRQIYSNIINNALKYTTNGTITVEAKAKDDKYLVIISDTGPGIKKEDAEKAFDKFEKLGSLVQGIGLGLYIARRLITDMGGRIWIDTDYTDGCRVITEMPKTEIA